MFAQYFHEKEGTDCIITEKGFLLYVLGEDFLHICQCYVKPEFRKEGHARELSIKAEEVARENGKRYVSCDCDLALQGAGKSMKAILSRFEPVKQDTIVKFFKEVDGWEQDQDQDS